MMATEKARSSWWKALCSIMRNRKAKTLYPLVLLGDFNAAVGTDISRYIGDHNGCIENANGTEMRKMAESFALYPLSQLAIRVMVTLILLQMAQPLEKIMSSFRSRSFLQSLLLMLTSSSIWQLLAMTTSCRC